MPPEELRLGIVRQEVSNCSTTDAEANVKIHLDSDKCQGHGRCYSLAQELFDADELGNAVVLVAGDLSAEQLELATKAANNCPEYAIEIGA
jgi:ferredoxin